MSTRTSLQMNNRVHANIETNISVHERCLREQACKWTTAFIPVNLIKNAQIFRRFAPNRLVCFSFEISPTKAGVFYSMGGFYSQYPGLEKVKNNTGLKIFGLNQNGGSRASEGPESIARTSIQPFSATTAPFVFIFGQQLHIVWYFWFFRNFRPKISSASGAKLL